MPALVPFHCFPGDLGSAVHDLREDAIKVALTAVEPSQAGARAFGDIIEIASGAGYEAGGRQVVNVTYAEDPAGSGIWKLASDDIQFTAVSGLMGPFRYAVFYNSSSPEGALIGFLDLGSNILLADGNGYLIRAPRATGLLDIGAGAIP